VNMILNAANGHRLHPVVPRDPAKEWP
jgi:hypothetical protein